MNGAGGPVPDPCNPCAPAAPWAPAPPWAPAGPWGPAFAFAFFEDFAFAERFESCLTTTVAAAAEPLRAMKIATKPRMLLRIQACAGLGRRVFIPRATLGQSSYRTLIAPTCQSVIRGTGSEGEHPASRGKR
jgi:hypothetical protein